MTEPSFTSWKLDWLDALNIGVRAPEFRVAVALLQHCNSETKRINPSQAKIALMLDIDRSSVERAITKLVSQGAMRVERQGRQSSNRYRFLDDWRDRMLAVKVEREAEWRELRQSDPAKMQHQKRQQNMPDPAKMRDRDPAKMQHEHLKGTPGREKAA